jgi:hypothetical protein
MLESTAEQVSVVFALNEFCETVIVAEPVPTQSNSCVVVSGPGLAIVASLVVHVAVPVTFGVVPSESVSVPVN